ncbi:MAG: nucleoside hydrolase [Bacteroidia bacterium]|nr:nucleoside hydrolase [Bacteroidia bacterium]
MKSYKPLVKTIIILFLIIILLPTQIFAQGKQQKKIIYDTDMCLDVDDVGAMALLHALENKGESKLLAVVFNEVHSSGAPAIDAINTWYGRGNIPIGIYKDSLSKPDISPYLEAVAKFPHDLETANAPSALDVYRKALRGQPDGSVTIISVGFLNNLNDLLIAEPELVAKKVKELVIMAGLNNDGFNLTRHNLTEISKHVIDNWPTPLVISHNGGSIRTGEILKDAPEANPVREGFYKYFKDSFKGRSSWDELAVLYGVRGVGTVFNEITIGTGSLPNGYVWNMKPGFRSHLEHKISDADFVKIIEDLMLEDPQK